MNEQAEKQPATDWADDVVALLNRVKFARGGMLYVYEEKDIERAKWLSMDKPPLVTITSDVTVGTRRTVGVRITPEGSKHHKTARRKK